jgi:methionyl-tRNA formyltransferase
MKVLLLSPYPERIIQAIREEGDEAIIRTDAVDERYCADRGIDFIVSYGFRHILRRPLIGTRPAVNLHISYLPWNRGADPNLWSWIDGAPKGVTVHWIDEGLDTGPIIAQELVSIGLDETLATSYHLLQAAVERLFADNWPAIRAGKAPRLPQRGEGSSHFARERAGVAHLLTDGWETRVRNLARVRYRRAN